MNSVYYVSRVLLRHNNSAEIQKKLKALGFAPLKWTVSDEPEQNLIASSDKRTEKIYPGYGRKAEEKIYNGSFWCAGISELKSGNECYDAGQDVEKFLEIAGLLINNKWLYFDENWNRIEKPEF